MRAPGKATAGGFHSDRIWAFSTMEIVAARAARDPSVILPTVGRTRETHILDRGRIADPMGRER
jgi:hypothetical protein